MKQRCPNCGSTNVYGMTRVVGYYSKINNWNKGKLAELKDRQKGNYAVGEQACFKSAVKVNKIVLLSIVFEK